jgi:RHS repeat-associated protein
VETVTQYNAASSGSVVDQVKYIHDGWGNLTNFRQDLDSTVGGSGYWEVAYAYAKATGGRNTLRRTQTTLPGGEVFKFHYRTGTASNDDKYSRVTTVRDAEDTDLAGYQYNGAGQVVRTELSEVGIFSKSYNGSGTTFGRLDRFNRTLISSWTRDLATNRDIYKVTLGYDRNSNITSQDDAVHTGHDVAYANDDLNRLIDADEGTLSSGVIDSLTRKRRQQWTLNQAGNWNRDKVDLNGDADYLDAGELDDTRTHNAVNELLTRDTNTSSPAEFSLTYDAAGNMTDDGVYKYEWDAFYRLRKVKNQSNALVSEYWYNGLGYLVTRHQDTDADGDVDGSDLKFHTAYDEDWRQVATYRGSDADPKERFLYHWAGSGGYGGGSHIDSVVLRDRDMTNGWTGAADGTLEERVYYLQNWRADVVGLVEPDGSGGATMVEWVKYSAYGVPFALPAGDTDSDGDCDSTDDAQVTTWKNAPFYDVRGDLDLNGVVDAADETLVVSAHQSHGRGVITSPSIGNRKGYAGYETDAKLLSLSLCRQRWFDSNLGRFISRDPISEQMPGQAYLYTNAAPLQFFDPSGLVAECAGAKCVEFSGNPEVDAVVTKVKIVGYYDLGAITTNGVRREHKITAAVANRAEADCEAQVKREAERYLTPQTLPETNPCPKPCGCEGSPIEKNGAEPFKEERVFVACDFKNNLQTYHINYWVNMQGTLTWKVKVVEGVCVSTGGSAFAGAQGSSL